ncbi:pyruvate phosphate dikinase [Rhodobacter phage RcZahn]|nr:pyruvate phosphate dikinase [Rhodobacter phage RcZahn]
MYHRIYQFSASHCEWLTQGGDHAKLAPKVAAYEQKRILGGKGGALVDMCAMGLPVPPGFTITTEVCNAYRQCANPTTKELFVDKLMAEVMERYARLSEEFKHPPLVSVRSGAPISMPGMMDTILNVGLTSENLGLWSELIGQRAALDSYRRLIQMMGSTAFGVASILFEEHLEQIKEDAGVVEDKELSIEDLQKVVDAYKFVFTAATELQFPDTVEDQLRASVLAVFDSWMNERAIHYRQLNKIDEAMGTAVNVQAMVFGNMGETSGSGVLFTRNPSTGEPAIMAEYLSNAQGEDVVAGIRTPQKLVLDDSVTPEDCPMWMVDLKVVCARLEDAYRDMVDVEFTVQDGKLFILQSRSGKRSARAAIRIAYDMAVEGRIDEDTAVSRITAEQYKIARRPGIDPKFDVPHHMMGLPACPGVVTGRPVFSSAEAVEATDAVILVTHETTPDDIAGMNKAAGILTQTGGATSHAAVVARAMDKPCVVGCTDLEIQGKLIGTNGVMFADSAKDTCRITIDGSTGRVWVGVDVPLVDTSDSPEMQALALWCLRMGGFVETMVMNPADPEQEAHICVSEWWGDADVLDVILDEMAALQQRSHLTLDLREPRTLMPQVDHQLLDCFTGPPVGMDEFLALVVGKLMGRDDLKGLILMLSDLNKVDVTLLRQKGYVIPKTPETVADLLGSATMAPTQEFIEKVMGGDAAWKTFRDLLQKGGFEMRTPKRAVPLDYAVFRQLKSA